MMIDGYTWEIAGLTTNALFKPVGCLIILQMVCKTGILDRIREWKMRILGVGMHWQRTTACSLNLMADPVNSNPLFSK